LSPDGEDPLRPRPAFEHAALAAEHGLRDRLAPLLAMARAEGRDRAALPAEDSAGWAAARIDILDAIDPGVPAGGPGPWAGLVGETARRGARLPSITGVEDFAACPFRALLVRRLGLAPMPDPRSGLPDTRGALVGTLVHAVLERIAADAIGRHGGRIDELAAAVPTDVPWPDDERLEAIVMAAADSLARRHGLVSLGMVPLLAAQARPFLAAARASEWGADGVVRGILGVEVGGELAVEGWSEPLRFRADRVDRTGIGLAMVDYKTSSPPSKAKKEETRRQHLLVKVARGSALQGVAYALAVPGQPAEGRYLHLKADLGGAPEEARHVRIQGDDAALSAAFSNAVAAVAATWRSGAMFARVEEPNREDGRGCAFCSVKEACLRDDSAVRGRLVAWLTAADPTEAPIEAAARRLWRLGFEAPEEAP
jgi:RecB family exonuclease